MFLRPWLNHMTLDRARPIRQDDTVEGTRAALTGARDAVQAVLDQRQTGWIVLGPPPWYQSFNYSLHGDSLKLAEWAQEVLREQFVRAGLRLLEPRPLHVSWTT